MIESYLQPVNLIEFLLDGTRRGTHVQEEEDEDESHTSERQVEVCW